MDWDERNRKPRRRLARELMPQSSRVARCAARSPITPPSLGQGFRERPINFVIVSGDSYENMSRVAQQFVAEMAEERRASCSPTTTCA